MTKREAKEAVAKEHGFDNWNEVCEVLPNSEHHKSFLDLENEAMDLYAHQFQKKINEVEKRHQHYKKVYSSCVGQLKRVLSINSKLKTAKRG